MSTFISPAIPLNPKIERINLEPHTRFELTSVPSSTILSGHILILGFTIAFSLITVSSPMTEFSKQDTFCLSLTLSHITVPLSCTLFSNKVFFHTILLFIPLFSPIILLSPKTLNLPNAAPFFTFVFAPITHGPSIDTLSSIMQFSPIHTPSLISFPGILTFTRFSNTSLCAWLYAFKSPMSHQ